MSLPRPSASSPNWLFQDFLYAQEVTSQFRYLQVKWDGQQFHTVSETFDYSDPPFVGFEQRGGSIVAQIDYTMTVNVITIEKWETNWRDDWPLRLASNYLVNCLYNANKNYAVRVIKSPADAFWISQQFVPLTNDLTEPFLYYQPL